ncbi:MAG: hypothetical protein ABIR32_16275 [Ilumatobacteraceae bacterium]
MIEGDRFQDDGRTLGDFVEQVLVACPRCGRCAVVLPIEDPAADPRSRWSLLRRLTCGHCAFTQQQPQRTSSIGVPFDPYFSLPLWMSTDAVGHRVWAYNAEHLDYLLRCVSARLRERAPDQDRHRPQTLMERLPTWMLAASSREPMTRALRTLAHRAAETTTT